MRREQRAEPFARSINIPVIQVSVLVHVGLVNDANHGLGLDHVHLGVLVLLLVGSLADSETIVANELLGHLLGLTVERGKCSRNTSRIQSTNRVVMLSQLNRVFNLGQQGVLTVRSSGNT